MIFLTLVSCSHANLLKNGDFEEGIVNKIPKNWGTEYYHSTLVPGKVSETAVKIENSAPNMSLGAQTVSLDYKKIKKVSLSAWIKLENVAPGPEGWNKANVQVLFFDAKGAQLGGWPEIGPFMGTNDWQKFGKNFYVPEGTAKAKVIFGIYGTTGTAYFDKIELVPVLQGDKLDPYNLIYNGEFEFWEGWAFGGTKDWGVENAEVAVGNGALMINNEKPIWSFASQSIPLDGKKIKKINVSAFEKYLNVVQGVKSWQLGRINLEFKDGKGKRLGGWPIVDSFQGSSDWKKVSKDFEVPAETRRVDVFAGLLECTGQVWFDDMKMFGYDSNGKKVKAGGISVTNTSGWYPFKTKASISNDSPVDVSFLLDAPAGKHGFMKAKDGHFYFEDGTRVRFWGTNIYAPSTFPKKEEAEMMAGRLSRFGCNLVRIHHLDAFWATPNIFDPNFNDTQHLSAEALDKMDYLVYQLKQKGIYIFMDLLVDRAFKAGDNVVDYENVERGAKISGFYDKRIIDLQKIYARELLTHVNPYTGLRYIDDPAIVSAKLINEGMLFYIGTQFSLSPYYLAELDQLFNNWLNKKYGGRNGLENAWTDRYGRCDLISNEDPSKGNVKRADIPLKYQRSGGERVDAMRLADTLKFYEEVQANYFKDMESYLIGLGLKVPVSGSNHWVNVAPDVKSNATLDYIDRHRYFDHPQFGYGTQVVFEDQPMVKDPQDALSNNFAYYKVKDKPFVVSEWNNCFPNEYRIEGPLMMASYANLQDWDGVLQFSFNHGGFFSPMEDNFDISAWPNVWSQWPAAAMIFLRKDVSVAKNEYEQTLGEKTLYGPINEDQPIADEPFLPLIIKTQISFGQTDVVPDISQYLSENLNRSQKEVTSDTKELKWNYGKGVYTINTENSQAALGFTKGSSIKLKDVTFSPKTNFCSLALSSLDRTSIRQAKNLLLTAAARIENYGQKFNESRTQLKEVGVSPIMVEGVDCKVTLKKSPSVVHALDINGDKVKNIAVNGNSFNISKNDKAFFYEIIFK